MTFTRTMIAAFAVAAVTAACASDRPADSNNSAAPPVTAAPTSPTVAPAPQEGTGPSFDCAKLDPATAHEAETLVCNDPQLGALDRQLAAEYTHAEAQAGADKATLEATQRGWVAGRNDCWKADDLRRCVVESYRTRLVELKLDDPDTVVPPTVTYRCPGDKRFTARFYTQFDPPAAILTWGEDTAVVFAEESGSGSRYGRDGVDFWEHQGEVTVDFFGNALVCQTP